MDTDVAYKKYFAILPRGFAYAAVTMMVITVAAFAVFREGVDYLFSLIPDDISLLVIIGCFFGLSLVIYYLLAWWAVNQSGFTNRYLQSVKRTKNTNYRRLLERAGMIYDEKLPAGIRFSAKIQNQIDRELSCAASDVDIPIPSLDASITNA